ncbi:hypothetical protein DAEQUDRAFT_728029, partial [Daedalea quercina L-15889]
HALSYARPETRTHRSDRPPAGLVTAATAHAPLLLADPAMVHFDHPARVDSPPSPSQEQRAYRLLAADAYFSRGFWQTYHPPSPTGFADYPAAPPDHPRPLPVHPPGVVPSRPAHRLPSSASPVPPSPHDSPSASLDADRPVPDPSHARPPASLPLPPWYTARMQYFPPPPPLPAAAPPAPVHKVWILDCKSCGTFLTNRGMKAVLLLRPNVPLYSTDALPTNCAAYTPPSASPAPSPTSLASTSPTSPVFASPPSLSSSSSSSLPPLSPNSYSPPYPPSPNVAPRTCDCLTQSLHCTTCGAGVGYTIVTPCLRCTTSISASQRATNGHRLSPSAEARERVRTESSDSIPSLVSLSDTSAPPSPVSPRDARTTLSPARFPLPLDGIPRGGVRVRSPPSPTLPARTAADPPPPPPARAPPSLDAQPQRLTARDALYWHHLVRSGEIPAVVDDHRARLRRRPDDEVRAEGKPGAGARMCTGRGSVGVPVKSAVFAGR